MFTREEKRRAFLIVMNGYMERHAAEIQGAGITDLRLIDRIGGRLSMRLVWGEGNGILDPVSFTPDIERPAFETVPLN